MELQDPPAGPRADEPPAPAAEGLRRLATLTRKGSFASLRDVGAVSTVARVTPIDMNRPARAFEREGVVWLRRVAFCAGVPILTSEGATREFCNTSSIPAVGSHGTDLPLRAETAASP